MTYLKEIKSKNGRTLKERLNHSGSGILAAALFGCFGLLASCTAGDDSLDNGTDTGANVKTASNVSVKQSSSDRITLFKTSGTRAVTRSTAKDLTMPAEPTKEEILQKVDNQKVFYIPEGTSVTVDNIYWGDGEKYKEWTTLYIGGEVIIGANATLPKNIVILKTGKLIATDYSEIPWGTFYCYNPASDAYTFRTSKTTDYFSGTFMTVGNFSEAWQIAGGELYVGGNYSSDKCLNNGGTIMIAGSSNFPAGYEMYSGSMYVSGHFSAKFLDVSNTDITVSCSIKTTGDNEETSKGSLYITSGTLTVLSGGYIETPSLELTASGKMILGNGGYINITDIFNVKEANAGTITIGDDNSNNVQAVIKTDRMSSNKSEMEQFFAFKGTDSSLGLTYNTREGNTNIWNFAANVKVNDDNNIVIASTTDDGGNICNPGFNYTPDEGGDDDTPTGPTIDDIAVIENISHEHVLSATCVDWNEKNNKVYVSWHARGTGQAGCLEVFDHSDADHPSLVSYMQAWSGTYKEDYTKKDYSEQNDEQKYIDYNHCIYDEAQNRLYAVGNCYAVGGHLSYIALGSDGTFDDSKEYDEYSSTEDITNGGVLKYIALNHGTQTSCDGNCIIRQGDDFLVASTSGFETFDASTLKSTNFAPTIDDKNEGKGKHIATDGTNILTLNYDRVIDKKSGENEDTPVKAIVKSYSASDHTFSNANTVIDATETIAPNDGKNTIAVNGNYAYVCLSEGGLVIYDLNGNKINSFVKDKVKIQGVEVAGGLCNGVAVDDDYIYVAYGSFGLYVFDKAKALDGETMEPVASYKCSKSCNYIKVVDRDGYHYLYVAYGESGLRVCRIAKK